MKFLHAMIRVKDLDHSANFYKEALGLEISKRRDYPDDKFTLLYMKDENGFEVEFTYNYGKTDYTHGDYYGHLAFHSDDLEKSYEHHQKMGCVYRDIQSLSDGASRYYFIKDPDGFQIEIIG